MPRQIYSGAVMLVALAACAPVEERTAPVAAAAPAYSPAMEAPAPRGSILPADPNQTPVWPSYYPRDLPGRAGLEPLRAPSVQSPSPRTETIDSLVEDLQPEPAYPLAGAPTIRPPGWILPEADMPAAPSPTRIQELTQGEPAPQGGAGVPTLALPSPSSARPALPLSGGPGPATGPLLLRR